MAEPRILSGLDSGIALTWPYLLDGGRVDKADPPRRNVLARSSFTARPISR